MKKFFTSILALAAMGVASAGVTLTYNGEPLADGATLNLGYEVEAQIFAKWEPNLCVVSTTDTTIGLEGCSEDTTEFGKQFQDCTVSCIDAPFFTSYEVTANTPLKLGLHRSQAFIANVSQDLVAYLTVYDKANPDDQINITINFLAKSAEEVGGISKVASDGSYVRLDGGNTLKYNVAKATRLEVYSILGTRMIDRAVNGTGSVSLSGLSRGVYIYRAGRLTGKIVVK